MCPQATTTDSKQTGNPRIADIYRREEIIDILKTLFAEKMKDNLSIFGIDKSSLTDFTTTEKDMKRGVNKFPPIQYRLKQEDIIKVDSTVVTKAAGGLILGDADNTFEF